MRSIFPYRMFVGIYKDERKCFTYIYRHLLLISFLGKRALTIVFNTPVFEACAYVNNTLFYKQIYFWIEI